MNLRKTFFAATLTALVFGFASTAFAKDEWLKVQSKNFQLVGNASDKDIRRVATKLEQFREAFRLIFPRVKYNSAIPTNVIVFKSGKSFKDYKPVDASGKTTNWVAGFFQSGEDVNYIALSLEGEQQQTYQTIFHEYVHFLVDNDMGRSNVPPWFNEGLAEYYEEFQIEDDQKVTLGGLDDANLNLLRNNKLIPLDTFFNIDYYSLHQQGSDGAGLYYAQAWALMHYFMQSNNGARNPQLSKFLNAVMNGKQPKEAFGEAFQMDYVTMEKELKKYVEQSVFRTSVATFKTKLLFDADMKTAPMSEADAKATLGDLLFHSNRIPEAEAHLKEALTLDVNSVLANTALGLVKARQKNFADAKKYLEKAISLDDKNYLAHYQYAYVLSREGTNEGDFVMNYDADAATKMRQSLKKSIALNPNFAEAFELFALVSIVRGDELDEALSYVQKAVALAPGNQWYQMRLAEIYERKEDFANARKIADRVAQTAAEPELRSIAQSVVRSIAANQEQRERIKNNGGETRQIFIESDKPLTEEEMAKMQEKAMIEGINAMLRKPGAGETRIAGVLSKIECDKQNNISYTIKVESGILKLTSADFQSLTLTTYGVDVPELQFGCGTLKSEIFGIITYRPKENLKTKTAGELVAIEIVPKNFKLTN